MKYLKVKYLKQTLAGVILGCAFMAGYGATAQAFPAGGILGRGAFEGYYTGVYSSTNLDQMFPIWYDNSGYGYGWEAIPGHIDSAQEFIDFIISYLYSGDAQRNTGAGFIIYTMISAWSWWNSGHYPPQYIIDEWAGTVRTEVARGSVTWRHWWNTSINSAYQRNINDGTWFDQWRTSWTMVFGWGAYAIRWECANPVNDRAPWPLIRPWQATSTVTVVDGAPNAGDTASEITTTPGATLTFSHRYQNLGPANSGSWWRIYGATRPGAWTASYWNNLTLSGSPVVTRSENTIYYDGDSSPAPGVAVDGFSARWTSSGSMPGGLYQFSTYNDDGARVYVDGNLIVNGWSNGGQRAYKAEINLAAGNHTIVVEFYEAGGPGHMNFEFKYVTQDWIYTEPFSPGENRLIHTDSVLVPLSTPAGSKICRGNVLYYANSWAGGHVWAPVTHPQSGLSTPYLACATVVLPQNLTPFINVQVNGVSGNRAEPGDTVTFTYAVNNTGSTSTGTNCTVYGLTRTGYYNVPNPIDSTSDAGFTQPAHGCPRGFPGGANTTLVTETVPVAQIIANRSICRSFFVNPASPTVGNLGTEVCAYVTSKPYARVYGGDISAGGGVVDGSGSCGLNTGAAIIGWNRRAATYGGAGVQFAAYAMHTIFDTSTTLGNGAGAAAAPSGLAFSNAGTNATNGIFGTGLGAVGCISDYYSRLPSGTTTLGASVDVGTLSSGSYTMLAGNTTLTGGALTAGEDITIYVDNTNMLINGNITYSGSWAVEDMPSFKLVVRGNVYIDNDVSRLDGLYVAQELAAGGNGFIITCANGSRSTPSLTGTLLTICDNTKLTVNGAMIARQIRFVRTLGTQRAGTSAETAAGGNMAEAFNYGPMMWIPQPSDQQNGGYDAISSLPPIL